MMNNLEWINAVAGKPWVDRADGPSSFDCWGLVIDSFRRVDGVELPDITGYNSGESIEAIGSPVRDQLGWPEIETPQNGAVFCVYLSNGAMVHVGRVLLASGMLYAVHAAGKDGKGQVTPEPMRIVAERYSGRIKYYMRPTNG